MSLRPPASSLHRSWPCTAPARRSFCHSPKRFGQNTAVGALAFWLSAQACVADRIQLQTVFRGGILEI